MNKTIYILAVLLLFVFNNVASADTKNTNLNIYEKPDANAKIIASVKRDEQLMPFFYTEKKDWVKIGNPKNGDVGWVKIAEFEQQPIVINKINATGTEQLIVDEKNRGRYPQIFVQYGSQKDLKEKDIQKAVRDIEKRNKTERENIQKDIQDLLSKFDSLFNGIQPIIIIPSDEKIEGNKIGIKK
jgi:uncharacterized protein YgiM (DUF1202 family)